MKYISTLIFLFSLAMTNMSQASTDKKWGFKKFGSEYFQEAVKDIIIDNRGIVYFLQKNQLIEYDGVRLKKIVIPDATDLYSLKKTSKGRVYVLGKKTLGFLVPDDIGSIQYKSKNQIIKQYLPSCSGQLINVHSAKEMAYFICKNGIIIEKKKKISVIKFSHDILSSSLSNNTLFVITDRQGLFKLNKNNKWSPIKNSKGIRSYISTKDSKGKIVMAALGKGLVVYDPTEDAFSYLLENAKLLTQETITRIVQYGQRYLVGTLQNGLKVISATRQIEKTIAIKNGLPGNDVWGLFSDHEGTLWVSTEKGIGKLSKNIQHENKDAEKIPFTSFVREVISTKDKKLIFGGTFFKEQGGVQTIEWSKLNFKELDSGQNAIRFSFSTNSMVGDNKIEYQSMLEGQDKEWSEWSTRTVREYTNLIWRDYTFKVKARKKGTNIVSNVSIFRFAIDTPWYESIGFYIFQIGLLVGIFIFAAFGRDTGMPKRYTEICTVILLAIIFGYVQNKIGIEAFIEEMNTGGFLKLLASAALGVIMKPAEDYGEHLVDKIGEYKKKYYANKKKKS